MQPTIPVNAKLLDDMEMELGSLAARWRSADNEQESAALVHQYQQTLRAMMLLGFRNWLDVESELPERYMPAEYVSGEFLKDVVRQPGDIVLTLSMNINEITDEQLIHFLSTVNELLPGVKLSASSEKSA